MVNADPVEIDGIWYNLISKANVAEVTRNPSLPDYAATYSGEVTIPDKVIYEGEEYSVTSIGKEAFYVCKKLTSVTIPNSVISIGQDAFGGCRSLTSMIIPNSVTSIERGAFNECSGLTSLTISSNVTSIGNAVIYGCSSLTSVTIPNSVTSIGPYAFWGCSGLTSLTIPNSVTSIDHDAFSGCSSLTSVTIPNSVTKIEYETFQNCSSLTSITIPSSVTSIGWKAFNGCSNLKSITIGSGVTSIKEKAFSQCSELKDVYCMAENVPTTLSDAFENSYIDYATLHVPESLVNNYKASVPWSSFKEIEKISYFLSYIVDGEEYKKIEIEEGEAITPEAAPTKEGYTFSGWSEIPETMPAEDVTVTGTFNINNYNLIYKVDGEDYKTVPTEYNSAITPETAPTREHYTFSGWSDIPATMPANDVTVTGSFSISNLQGGW